MASTPEPVPRSRILRTVERQQAAARGAVVAGTERKRRLDLDADAVAWNFCPIVGAMNGEASGHNRRQAGKAFAHPIGGRGPLEAQRLRVGARGHHDEIADRRLIGRSAEMDRHPPAPGTAIHETHSDIIGRKILDDKVGNAQRRWLIGFERRNGRVDVWSHCCFQNLHGIPTQDAKAWRCNGGEEKLHNSQVTYRTPRRNGLGLRRQVTTT
jgi:hypothetical protein